jgi:hypothetical protein
MLKRVGEEIWTLDSAVKMPLGLRMSVRSTVLRLSSRRLMVISPVQTSPEDLRAIAALGDVRYIVAPNCMHHRFLSEFSGAFPTAEVWGPHCLQDKRRDVHFKGTLSTQETMPWEAEVEMIVVKAKAPMIEEFIFFHPVSKTIILTDLLFNYQRFDHWTTKLIARMNGAYRKLAMTRIAKSVFNDPQSLHRAASHLLAWNAENLIVAHGDLILGQAGLALREPLSEFAAINS